MDYGSVKDSGERREATTGAVRDRAKGKGRYDLLPPFAIHRKAKHFENGAEKYDARNWERGIPLSWFLDSALRHIFKLLAGRIEGKVSEEDHAAAAAWNMDCFVDTEERIARGILPKELDDLPGGPAVMPTAADLDAWKERCTRLAQETVKEEKPPATILLNGTEEDLDALGWKNGGEK